MEESISKSECCEYCKNLEKQLKKSDPNFKKTKCHMLECPQDKECGACTRGGCKKCLYKFKSSIKFPKEYRIHYYACSNCEDIPTTRIPYQK